VPFHRNFFLGDLVEVLGGIRFINRPAIRIRSNQPVADIGDIELPVIEILPGMWVGDDLRLAALFLDHGARLHALGSDYNPARKARRLFKTIYPALEGQAVDKEDIGRSQPWRRLGSG
jgi:hypothetical protein